MKSSTLLKLLKKASRRIFPHQQRIDGKIQEIVKLEEKLNRYFDESGFREKCKICVSVCCTNSILNYLKIRNYEAYYVAKMNPDFEQLLTENRQQKLRCAFLGKNGCVLNPKGMPKVCLTYVCNDTYKRKIQGLNDEITKKFLELESLLK